MSGGLPALTDDEGVHDRLLVATEAIASGSIVRGDLDRGYTKLYRNVYVRSGVELTAVDRALAAWLWSGRRATGRRPFGGGSPWQQVDSSRCAR